jgi:thiol-disulfide isomerase/thioredoxin
MHILTRPIRWFAIALLLSACGANTATSAPTTAANVSTSATTAATVEPTILTIPFTDAHTGQTLTLASFAGKTVVVEGMAAWCTNCLAQQKQVVIARQKFGPNVEMISLDIDASEDAPQLVKYAADKGFDWRFTLANKPLMDALVAKYGRTITNPSNMPMFIISPDGTLSALLSGGHSADDLVTQVSHPPVAS